MKDMENEKDRKIGRLEKRVQELSERLSYYEHLGDPTAIGVKLAEYRQMKEEYEYDYRSHILQDCKERINELMDDGTISPDQYLDRDEIIDKLSDMFWTDDSVTGNGSGSYTFSTWKAAIYLSHNYETLAKVMEDWDVPLTYERLAEYERNDALIRTYMYNEVLPEAVDSVVPETWWYTDNDWRGHWVVKEQEDKFQDCEFYTHTWRRPDIEVLRENGYKVIDMTNQCLGYFVFEEKDN